MWVFIQHAFSKSARQILTDGSSMAKSRQNFRRRSPLSVMLYYCNTVG